MTPANPPRSPSNGLQPSRREHSIGEVPRLVLEHEYKVARLRIIERAVVCALTGVVTVALAVWGPAVLVWAMAGVLAAVALSVVLLAMRTEDPNGFVAALRGLITAIAGFTPPKSDDGPD